jgi:hypothetical protein
MSGRYVPIDHALAASLHLGPWLIPAALVLAVLLLLGLYLGTTRVR